MNTALDIYDESFEIIEGEKIMSPSPGINHNLIAMRLANTIMNYFIPKNLGYVLTEMDVHFPDGNLIKPDLIVIGFENRNIMNRKNAIYGVPDMTVEIFSRSTRKRDITIKKNIYETNGVKEYWTIDPFSKTVEVYILRDGKFDFGTEYFYYDNEEWQFLSEEEKLNSKQEITLSTFNDLTVKLRDIFEWCI